MKLFGFLHMSCHEATLLASKRLEEPLTVSQRLKLRFHNLICKPCLYFYQQIKKIHDTIQSGKFQDGIVFDEQKKIELEKIIKNSL